MIAELRPLSLGEILDRTISLYRGNFVLFAGIALFPVAAYFLTYFLVSLADRELRPHIVVGYVAAKCITMGYKFLVYVVHPILAGLAACAINRAVYAIYLDQAIGLTAAYQQLRTVWPGYVWLRISTLAYGWIPFALLYTVGVFGGTITPSAPYWRLTRNSVLGTLLLLAFVFGFWMSLRYSLSIPAFSSGELSVRMAIRRSIFLTRKGRGRILVLAMIYSALSYGGSYAARAIIGYIFLADGRRSYGSFVYTGVAWLSTLVISSLLYPVVAVGITLFYFDARVRKEGFDIEWMMRQANLPVPDPQSTGTTISTPQARTLPPQPAAL